MAKVKREKNNADIIRDSIVKGMQEKKAERITLIDLKGLFNPLADFLVICTANSDRQAQAIAEEVEKEVYKTVNEEPWLSEGKDLNEWIVLDYVNVIAHIFLEDKREFYGLEDLWGDGRIKEIEVTPESADKK